MRINVNEWGIVPGRRKDTSFRLRGLLDFCRMEEETELIFERGEYHFFPDYAAEKLLYISNHDEDTIKRIAFDLSGCNNLTIRGNGAMFLFHTDILPFYCHECRHIHIEGIQMDYERPSYSEAVIAHAEPGLLELSVDRVKYPFFVKHKRLYFTGENFCHELQFWLEMDGEKGEPIAEDPDFFFNLPDGGAAAEWKETKEGAEIRLVGEGNRFSRASREGNRLILRHHPRNYPGFYVTDSVDIVCKDIELYHSEGMAFIAQYTENIELERFNITFNPKNRRAFTAAADGFHFVCCSGLIRIKDCLAENQLDDPLNIHGIYFRIREILGKGEYLAELVHHQQKGVKPGKPGDVISLVDKRTMLEKGNSMLAEYRILNKDFCVIKLEDEIQGLVPGDVFENRSCSPDLCVEGSTFRNNRARGLLLTTAGKVIVKNNFLHVPGAALLISGDCREWFESGASGPVIVENNIFDKCAYVTNWGKAPIQVSPETVEFADKKRVHDRLEIRNNKFICTDSRLIWAQNIDTIVFEGNQVILEEGYPEREGESFYTSYVNHFIDKND